MAVGRLRGAVKAADDAAIATKIAAGLLIFENMIAAQVVASATRFDTPFAQQNQLGEPAH